MDEQSAPGGYVEPRLVDYGDLVDVTADMALLLGASDVGGLRDLALSGVDGGGGGDGGGGNDDDDDDDDDGGDDGLVAGVISNSPGPAAPDGSGSLGETATGSEPEVTGGSTGAGPGSPGGGAGGGALPFTGYAAALAAGLGSALVGAGTALRRLGRRHR